MGENFSVPSVDEVERITQIEDPVIRNLQITQCYHELSAALAGCLGLEANWCTFATWASKQAGQTIRKEDLARLFERGLAQSPSALAQAEGLAAALEAQGADPRGLSVTAEAQAERFRPAVERASQAVARGNLKVFEEIGRAFARFLETCFVDGRPDAGRVAGFCAELRPGEPPEGQGYLRRAFARYAQAAGQNDTKTAAQLVLLANLEIGLHEQTRLQPEIAESLDAGWISFMEFTRGLFAEIFPAKGWFHLLHLYLMRLLGRPTGLDRAIQSLVAEARVQLRKGITEIMMTITLPSGEVLRLGKDLNAVFPEPLRVITQPELRVFLEAHDLTPDSLIDTGASDWADLAERLHFIADLFRSYQERANLFEPPFTAEQVEALKAGRLPRGRL